MLILAILMACSPDPDGRHRVSIDATLTDPTGETQTFKGRGRDQSSNNLGGPTHINVADGWGKNGHRYMLTFSPQQEAWESLTPGETYTAGDERFLEPDAWQGSDWNFDIYGIPEAQLMPVSMQPGVLAVECAGRMQDIEDPDSSACMDPGFAHTMATSLEVLSLSDGELEGNFSARFADGMSIQGSLTAKGLMAPATASTTGSTSGGGDCDLGIGLTSGFYYGSEGITYVDITFDCHPGLMGGGFVRYIRDDTGFGPSECNGFEFEDTDFGLWDWVEEGKTLTVDFDDAAENGGPFTWTIDGDRMVMSDGSSVTHSANPGHEFGCNNPWGMSPAR